MYVIKVEDNEANVLLRALALARRSAATMEQADDLDLLKSRILDEVYADVRVTSESRLLA